MRARRTDTTHRQIAEAIRTVLRKPVKSLHTQGGGVEDLLVPLWLYICGVRTGTWLFVECKTSRNKAGTVTDSQYTEAQKAWRNETPFFPRITATSAQDAIDQIRKLELKDHRSWPFTQA